VNELKIITIISVILLSGLFVNEAFALDAVWSFREQRITNTNPPECFLEGSTTFSKSIVPPHLDLDMADVQARQGFCHVFKVFNATDVINKNLNVTWAGTFIGSNTDHRITIFDGSYLRSNNTDFPLTTGTGFNSNKGAYILHELFQNSGTFGTTNDVINMTLAGATQPEITVRIGIRDGSTGNSLRLDLTDVKIEGLGFWQWGMGANYTHENDSFGGAFGFFDTTFADLQVPDAITDLSLTVVSGTQVDLSWTTNNGGSPILSFDIFRNLNGAGFALLQAVADPTLTAFSDNTLSSGDQVKYGVRAVNANGNAPPSNIPPPVTTTGGSVPDAVTDLALNVISGTQVDLSWSTASSSPPLLGYKVYRNLNGAGFVLLVLLPDPLATSFSDTTLSPGDQVKYGLIAVNPVGSSAPSNIPPFVTTP